jgi:hypothetical protein
VTRVSPKTTGPGRPPVRFQLTTEGGARFPTLDAELLQRLLTFLNESGQHQLIVQFFQTIWSERRAALLNRLHTDDFATVDLPLRLEALRELLAESRFMPQIERAPTSESTCVLVRECNCPLPAAVRATRIPCRLETEFLHDRFFRISPACAANDFELIRYIDPMPASDNLRGVQCRAMERCRLSGGCRMAPPVGRARPAPRYPPARRRPAHHRVEAGPKRADG